MSDKESENSSEEVAEKSCPKTVYNVLNTWAPVIKVSILAMIAILAFSIRIFSVIRYESIIHEFDPWFNFRATKYLASNGFYKFWNWFDSETWYPLGRVIGGTVYPGVMVTASSMYWLLQYMHIPIDIRDVCVFTAPLFSAFTAVVSYLMTKEISKRTDAGLLSAFFIAIVPSYISRSVAGSYDNEAVAIFALVFTFYLYIKALKTGSIMWSALCGFGYIYMVASWGGYSFIINIIPLFVLGLMLIGRFNDRVYVSYCVFYVVGTLFSAQIPFVGFNVIKSAEHLASHGIFIVCQIYMLSIYLSKVDVFNSIKKMVIYVAFGGFFVIFSVMILFGYSKWSGRNMTLLDPTYASKYIPIIASVSEHQATVWTQYFFDLNILVVLMPVGIYFCCITQKNKGKIFALLYGVTAIYFSSVMIRLMLVVAPAACILSAIGLSEVLRSMFEPMRKHLLGEKKLKYWHLLCMLVVSFMGYLIKNYLTQCTYIASEGYSSPSVILGGKMQNGAKVIIDDYREAYYWLRQNTPTDAKIMSWWDYGYQITGIGNRTTIVDNNTWNNTHIATVGAAMSSNENDAFEICKLLDVDYVLVIFGGNAYYSSDDISKFLWMVRIGGGVYPKIKEPDYYSEGQYRTDKKVSITMRNSLMYRLCYYRFDEISNGPGRKGYDTVRQAEIGYKGFKLTRFTEAYTSDRWIVRIYKVNKEPNLFTEIKDTKMFLDSDNFLRATYA